MEGDKLRIDDGRSARVDPEILISASHLPGREAVTASVEVHSSAWLGSGGHRDARPAIVNNGSSFVPAPQQMQA